MDIRKIIKEEIDDFDWTDEIVPTRMDKQHFDRGNTLRGNETTTMFGNVVRVGEKFLPPNSSNVWEIVSMTLEHTSKHRGEESHLVRLVTKDGKKGHVWWEKPLVHTTPNGTFPRRKGPWRKIVGPITDVSEVHTHLDEAIKSCMTLMEEREPDMVWDFTKVKGSIDKSKEGVNTEEVNDFDWVSPDEPKMVNDYHGTELDINTEEAQKNFGEEKNGNYVIRTPKGKEEPETILAYGGVPYIKNVINYLNNMGVTDDSNLYFGTIRYSRKDKDKVLDYIKYY